MDQGLDSTVIHISDELSNPDLDLTAPSVCPPLFWWRPRRQPPLAFNSTRQYLLILSVLQAC